MPHACCACITKLHLGLLKLHSIADTVVHKSVIATIKPCTPYTCRFGFMLLAVAYFVSFQTEWQVPVAVEAVIRVREPTLEPGRTNWYKQRHLIS